MFDCPGPAVVDRQLQPASSWRERAGGRAATTAALAGRRGAIERRVVEAEGLG